MKALNLIICLLAVTLFVACSKKKDGNSQPYPTNPPYGFTPNDINSGYQAQLPGYHLPQGCGTGQMFSDLVSYCGWLATDGERVCDRTLVRRTFLQYCQNFAVRFNYCVPQVRTGCFYMSSGCFGGTVKPRYRDSRRDRDLGDYIGSDSGGDDDYVPPTNPPNVLPPVVVKSPKCTPNPSKDCKKKSKKEEMICKLPSDPDLEEKYLYSYSEYMEIAASECEDASPVVSQPIQSAPVYREPIQEPVAKAVQQPVYSQPQQQEVTQTQECITYKSQPWIDCRLKRADWRSAVRGTRRTQLRDFDFKKDSSGEMPFAREVKRNNIICKPYGTKDISSNYDLTYSKYLNTLKSCKVATATSGSEVITTPISSQQPIATKPVKAAKKDFLGQCMDIEKLHDFILDSKNELSSSAEYYKVELLDKNKSTAFQNAWKTTIDPIINKYSISLYNRESHLSALGANIAQKNDQFMMSGQFRMVEKFGTIVDCSNQRNMVVKHVLADGTLQIVTYTWNGFMDEDLEITETTRGTFKYGNESSEYILARYIGVGKKLNEKQIEAKVLSDMKNKKYLK